MTIPLTSRISGNHDRLDLAVEAARIVLSSPPHLAFTAFGPRSGVAVSDLLTGDATDLSEHYAFLLSSKHGFTLFAGMCDDRLVGVLAHTLGDWDQAAAHFDEGLAYCRKAGYRPERAWTCCDYADALRDRGAEDDREKAIHLLDESLSISSELGMRPLMERVLSRREILGA